MWPIYLLFDYLFFVICYLLFEQCGSSSATLMRGVLVESSGGNGNSLEKSCYKDEQRNETAIGWESRVKRKSFS